MVDPAVRRARRIPLRRAWALFALVALGGCHLLVGNYQIQGSDAAAGDEHPVVDVQLDRGLGVDTANGDLTVQDDRWVADLAPLDRDENDREPPDAGPGDRSPADQMRPDQTTGPDTTLPDTSPPDVPSADTAADANTVDASRPSAVLAVVAGATHACAILEGGRLKCWGEGTNGRLGYGDVNSPSSSPETMGDALPTVDLGGGLPTVGQIALGLGHTCAHNSDGLKCWGRNDLGQLGIGESGDRGDGPGEMGDALPLVDLAMLLPMTAIAVGDRHSCALFEDLTVKCWGSNISGNLGLGDTRNRGLLAQEMGSGLPVVDLGVDVTASAIAAGEAHTCALTGSELKCWGSGASGRLGTGGVESLGDQQGEMGDELLPIRLDGEVDSFSVGLCHTCALLRSGALKCWGCNGAGQLGQGDQEARGDNPGEMGNNLDPVDLGGRAVQEVTLGTRHTCVLLHDGVVLCWGDSEHGQLGVGTQLDRGDNPGEMGDALVAVDLGTDRTAQAISAGGNHTCALLDDSTVKCWGMNDRSQLGFVGDLSYGDEPGEMGDALPRVDLGN